MAVREVLMIGNPMLRKECAEVKRFDDGFSMILKDLRETLAHLQNSKRIGRALAAPQIGHMKRVIYMKTPSRTVVMVNPKITWKSKETFAVWDSCFSFDVAFFIRIRRHKSIRVEFKDELGNPHVERFEGKLSELFQHEIDHLHGILATDYLEDNKQIILRSEWEKRHK